MISMRAACLCLVLSLAAAPMALAADADSAPVSTASATPPPAATQPNALPMASGGPGAGQLPVDDGKIHGMVEVGVGTGGYREAAVEAHGEVAPGVDASVFAATVQGPTGRVSNDRSSPAR